MALLTWKINGTNGADTLVGTNFNDEIRGKKGNDIIDGGLGKDYLYGEDGDDTLIGNYDDGTGDLFDGGAGIDTYKIKGSAVEHLPYYVNLATGRDQYFNRYVSIENVIGGNAADRITGSSVDNVLTGELGDDMLNGGGGNDTLRGGDGNDEIEGGTGADVIDGGAGANDTALYTSSSAGVTVSLVTGKGTGGDAQGDTLTGIEHLSGSNFDDTFIGDAGNNRLNGRGGNDTLRGGDGDDTLIGGAGGDVLDGGNGTDTASYEGSGSGVKVNLVTGGYGGRAGGDTYISIENVLGSDYDDVITGDAGVNRLTGAGGNDQLFGAGGNDQLIGGMGADKLDGGEGTDTANYSGSTAAVVLNLATGGTGGDAAGDTFTSIEFVVGTGFADNITGDNFNNRLTGGAGNDTLNGAGGNDTLVGGAGNDTLTGGAGYDVFWFREANEGNDVITDFQAGAGMTDRIWLGAASGVADWAALTVAFTDTASGVLISLGNGSLLLNGVLASSLVQDDFIF